MDNKISLTTSVFSPRIPIISPVNLWVADGGFNWMHFWAKLCMLSIPCLEEGKPKSCRYPLNKQVYRKMII